MKKYKATLIAIVLLIGGYYFYTKEEIKYLDKEIYFVDNIAYSISTDKKISGYVKREDYAGVTYRKYKDGNVVSEKKIDNKSQMISKKIFNKDRLLEGKSYFLLSNEKSNLQYKNNILNGKSEVGSIEINFVDGTINGKNMLPIYSYSKLNNQITYKNGIPDFLNIATASPEYPKKILVNTKKIPDKFTGGIINQEDYEMFLCEYVDGKLKRERIYTNNYGDIGLKLKDIIYYNNGKINKEFNYIGGILRKLITFNIEGEKEGVFYGNNLYDKLKIENYEKGVLNGESKIYYLNDENKIQELLGFYKLGIFSGQYLNNDKVEKFLNGFRIHELDLNKIKNNDKVTVENFEEVPEKFTGFNRKKTKNIIINEYNNGKLVKEYCFYENSDNVETKEFNGSGGYKFSLYVSGFVQNTREIDKNNLRNGKFEDYFYYGNCTKTTGTFTNNEPLGESIHYHENQVKYIDVYHPNKTYTRTYYKDYKNKIIEKVTKGKEIDGMWVEEEGNNKKDGAWSEAAPLIFTLAKNKI